MANVNNKVGAVGFIPPFFKKLVPFGLVKVNLETGEAVRDCNGLCIRCQPGEPGEFVANVVRQHPIQDFHGYVDKIATRKKLLHNVWKTGDSCYKSGDILVADKYGWVYFKDRIGDTFRWKGENVSTAEIENTVSLFEGTGITSKHDVIAYGIQIPGCEGKAGMIAIQAFP